MTIVNSRVIIKKDRRDELLAAVTALTKLEVAVGVPATEASRPADKGVNNAMLLFIHDQGSPAANIPARPVLKPGIMAVKGEITKRFQDIGRAALNGADETDIRIGFNQIGLIAQSALRARITNGPFEALKPATLAARKRKGFMGESPLIVTGQLRQALTYVVRVKKG